MKIINFKVIFKKYVHKIVKNMVILPYVFIET